MNILSYKLFEKNVWNVKKDLKHFKSVLNLESTITELMESISAFEMDIESIFPVLDGDENLSELKKYPKFLDELSDLKLKLSELFYTEELQTFSRLPLKWYWLYSEDASELDSPIYILFKYFYNNKWSNIKLYYIQEDISDFLNVLSTITIEFKVNNGKRWFYKSSNSGELWELITTPINIIKNKVKKEVKSEPETASFRPHLKWEDILNLSKRSDLDLFIY